MLTPTQDIPCFFCTFPSQRPLTFPEVFLQPGFDAMGTASRVFIMCRLLLETVMRKRSLLRVLQTPVTYTHTNTRTHTHTNTHTHAHAHTRTRAHAHTRTRAHAHTRTRAHAHTRARPHARTRARAHTH